MNSGAITQALEALDKNESRNRNRTNKQRERKLSSEGGPVSMSDSADVLKAQIIEIEKIRNEKSKAFDNINDLTSPDLNDTQRLLLKSNLLKGLKAVLQRRIEIKYSYLKLLALITFFGFYSASVVLQRDISGSFGVQSRRENHHK
jgi:hypothetical protein